MTDQENRPKVFVSYCHTSLAHKEFVRRIATEIRSKGIDVILDQWDVKIGYDLNAFMEQIRGALRLTHVLIFSDRSYKEKADKRQGGVGKEAFIITPEIYNSINQEKFVPIVCERDEEGEPYLPVFLEGRMYVDLSSERSFDEEFKKLVQHLYGQAEHQKPPLGKMPDFVRQDVSSSEDSKHIYQNYKKVGIVEEKVTGNEALVTFSEISETEDLDHREPFQYMGREYRIHSIEIMAGMMDKTVVSASGMKSVMRRNVLQGVKCFPLGEPESSFQNTQKRG